MFRRITSKRATRILLWIFITIVTLTVLLFVWTNWSGKRRWATAKAMIEREGETLDFHQLLPATPPEAANLLAIEPLRGIAAVVENDESKGEPGAKRKALEAMKWAKAPPAASGVSLGKTTEFQDWVKFLRDVKLLELPTGSATSGRDVLAALDAKLPLLKQLADEAPNRPQAMFTPGLREREMPEMLIAMKLPHYTHAQTLARLLALRARVAIEARDGDNVVRCVVAIKQLAAGCKREPVLIGFLVGVAVDAQAVEVLWQGLRERVFDEAELRLLGQVFGDSENALLAAMRGEMAMAAQTISFLQEKGRTSKEHREAVGSLLSNGEAGWVFPSALYDHWRAGLAERELCIIQSLKTGSLSTALAESKRLNDELEHTPVRYLRMDLLMIGLFLPASESVIRVAVFHAARQQQAQTAIALERFVVKQARHPATLEELVPEFLPSVPLDPCDGKPMRYRMTTAGRSMLWSVGFDGQDDGGKVTVDEKGSPHLNKREYRGDWAWQYEPVTH